MLRSYDNYDQWIARFDHGYLLSKQVTKDFIDKCHLKKR